MKKIAIIGAGPAGLTATKRISELYPDFECCTFELCDKVGGTWVYTDRIGEDEYGIPICTSMYSNLRTNLPKEIMVLPGYSHKGPEGISFITQAEVLQYFQDYTDHFDLGKYIKLRHYVKNITPVSDGKWKVTVKDLIKQKHFTYYFDAIMICVGRSSFPASPEIKNISNFSGCHMHSHDYRRASKFKNQTVIVVGGETSALDISLQISNEAKQVYLSHHSEKIRGYEFPENVEQKPDIREISNNGNVVFVDGSEVSADAIIYCTGYTFKYPFLDPECKVTVENSVIKPLYKHLINIEHPTMSFIGVNRACPSFPLLDLQVRCILNIFIEDIPLPSKQDMYAETEEDYKERLKVNGKEKYYHFLNKDNYFIKYCAEITELGKIPPVEPVMMNICSAALRNMREDYRNFRNKVYEVINDYEYAVRDAKCNGFH